MGIFSLLIFGGMRTVELSLSLRFGIHFVCYIVLCDVDGKSILLYQRR